MGHLCRKTAAIAALLATVCGGLVATEAAAATGLASWYGAPHHGRLTASGERFDMRRLTAAHRTLPLGSVLRVTNLQNGRSIDVRVNDRGPTVRNRVLDLSRAAATALGATTHGVVPVKFEVVRATRRGTEPPPMRRAADTRHPTGRELTPPARRSVIRTR